MRGWGRCPGRAREGRAREVAGVRKTVKLGGLVGTGVLRRIEGQQCMAGQGPTWVVTPIVAGAAPAATTGAPIAPSRLDARVGGLAHGGGGGGGHS